jgi:MoxR-like ATPase
MHDIHNIAHSVLRHRILLNFQAQAQGVTTDSIIDTLLAEVSPPASPLVGTKS